VQGVAIEAAWILCRFAGEEPQQRREAGDEREMPRAAD